VTVGSRVAVHVQVGGTGHGSSAILQRWVRSRWVALVIQTVGGRATTTLWFKAPDSPVKVVLRVELVAARRVIWRSVHLDVSVTAPRTTTTLPTGTTTPPTPNVLAITTNALPNGLWGGSYSTTLAASGGTAPYHWSVQSGNVPPGLTLTSSDGQISGTPSTEGSFSFTVQVTDSGSPAQSKRANVSIDVPAAEITNAAGESPFAYSLETYLGETGAAVSMAGTYAYRPAVIYDSATGETLMWFCAGDVAADGGQSGGNHGDAIWFSESGNDGENGSWSTPVEVIRSSNWAQNGKTHDDYLDGWQACDPSVAMANGYWYVAYTGSTNWTQGAGHKYTSECDPTFDEGNCDNRIFIARVPVGQETTTNSYEKLVDVGECASESCYQFQPFWQNDNAYPPVPIVRNEVGPVWRQAGTSTTGTGTTTPQTPEYGIGQPSLLNVDGELVIFFTDEQTKCANTSGPINCAENVWERPASDFDNPYALQDSTSYYQRTADRGNNVDYGVAYATGQNRYIATIAGTDQAPRVMYAHSSGYDLTLPSGTDPTLASGCPDSAPYELISCNLAEPEAVLQNTSPYDSNDAFERDDYGDLVSVPGHPGGSSYDWVYYASESTPGSGGWTIDRIPFSTTPVG
jgi:Putative Ig domain